MTRIRSPPPVSSRVSIAARVSPVPPRPRPVCCRTQIIEKRGGRRRKSTVDQDEKKTTVYAPVAPPPFLSRPVFLLPPTASVPPHPAPSIVVLCGKKRQSERRRTRTREAQNELKKMIEDVPTVAPGPRIVRCFCRRPRWFGPVPFCALIHLLLFYGLRSIEMKKK